MSGLSLALEESLEGPLVSFGAHQRLQVVLLVVCLGQSFVRALRLSLRAVVSIFLRYLLSIVCSALHTLCIISQLPL